MTADPDLRSHLAPADALRVDVDGALAAFHRVRPRRDGVRRAATIVTALGIAGLAFAVTWVASPFGDRDTVASPTGATGATEPSGSIAYMVVTADGEAASLAISHVGSATGTTLAGGPFAVYPTWSPDGTMIAYAAGEDYDHLELTVAEADGRNERGLGTMVEGTFDWSPDGASLTYIRRDELPNGYDVVAVVDVATGVERVVTRGLEFQSVSWSPDGERLAVAGHPPADDGVIGPYGLDVFTVRLDDPQLVPVTRSEAYEHFVVWSPDGSELLFSRSPEYDDADYPSDLWIVDADGSNERRLTDWEGFDSFPAWSPDGRWVAFASDRDATPEEQAALAAHEAFAGISLFVMRADGTDVRRIVTAAPGETLLPSSWRD